MTPNPSQPSAGCPIKQVPLEVLLKITESLSTKDLGSMRLSCRAIEEMLFYAFTREFFTRRQFMISPISLQALVDMSKSRMARHIRRLQFGIQDVIGPGSTVFPFAEAMKVYSDHLGLVNSGRDRDMIAEALKGLPNLEDVVIRDFNSPTRTREGRRAEWKSYGSETLLNDYGIETTNSMGLTGEKLFTTLLQALGDAEARPASLEILGRHTAYFSDYAFNYNPTTQPKIAPVLKNLTRLHLTTTLNGRAIFDSLHAENMVRNLEPSNLAWFLTRTPNLKDLRINTSHTGSIHTYISELMQWLGEAAVNEDPEALVSREVTPGWPEPVNLPLEEFSCSIPIKPKVLLSIFHKFAPTLRSIGLWKVVLADSIASDPDDEQSNRKKSILWKHLLKQLAGSHVKLDRLRKLMIGGIKEGNYDDHDHSYSALKPIRFGNLYQKTFSGSDWRHQLSQAVEGLAALPAGQLDYLGHGVDDDVHDDDDDDDESNDDTMFVGVGEDAEMGGNE